MMQQGLNPAALFLEFYYVEALRWEVNSEFDAEAENEPLQGPDLMWNLQRNDSAGSLRQAAFRLKLALPIDESNPGAFPYSFEIVLVGYFRLEDDVPQEYLQPILDSNAPSLLYGAARETLATSLGRGPFRPLVLPSVNFNAIARASDDPEPKALPKATASKATSTPATPKKRASKPKKA